MHGHRFEIYTLVSEIHENVDLVLGIKNVFELEGVINSRDCRFEFLNRSVACRILEENRKIDVCKNEGKFLIQMCSQAKTSGTKLLEVHRVRKELNSNLRPEKQHAMPKKGMTERLHIGQGRAGLRRKHEPDCINQPSDVTRRISERSKIVTGKTNNPQHTNGACDRGINNDK